MAFLDLTPEAHQRTNKLNGLSDFLERVYNGILTTDVCLSEFPHWYHIASQLGFVEVETLTVSDEQPIAPATVQVRIVRTTHTGRYFHQYFS